MHSTAAARESPARVVGCFLLMLAAIQLALGPKIRLSQWEVSAEHNAGVAEGRAWLSGRLYIAEPATPSATDRPHDTAWYKGRAYNVFPPLMSVLTVLLAPLHHLLLGRTDVWLLWTYVPLVFAPLPLLGFVVFRRQTGDSAWAALLTVAWLGGTAVLPNLYYAKGSQLGQVNHLLSQTGLLILVADLLGRRRAWPGLIGLLIAGWSRQMTLLYALPLLWAAWKQRRLPLALGGLTVIVAPLLALNWMKFGHPLEFGYRHIYVGRDHERLAQRVGAHGVFSLRYVPENAYHMHLSPPRPELAPNQIRFAKDGDGASIWLTSPLLLWVFLAARRWWADPARRALMLTSLLVMFGLLCYHSSGFLQPGYNRFALDFIPIWLAVVAPATRGGRRTWFTLGSVAWALLYFQAIVPNR
jgi:hypothetical protein